MYRHHLPLDVPMPFLPLSSQVDASIFLRECNVEYCVNGLLFQISLNLRRPLPEVETRGYYFFAI